MDTPHLLNQSEVLETLQTIAEKIEEETNKDTEEIDKEKLFKLRYKQLIQGMNVTQNPFYNNFR